MQCNDEFVEGRIGLYDEAGQPCVLVDGFRAISVSGVRRSGAPGGTRDVVYHVDWERTPSASQPAPRPALPLEQLQAAASTALEQVIAIRGRQELQAAMAAGDDLTAAQLAHGLREMGVTAGQKFTADSLRVATPMQPVFERLIASLVTRGLFKKVAAGYRPTPAFAAAADSAPEALRDFVAQHSGHLPEALLCAGNCAELGPILRGEKDAVQVLFSGAGAELLDQFYGDGLYTSHWLAAIGAAVQEAARHLPEGRGLRILEIGGGTGWLGGAGAAAAGARPALLHVHRRLGGLLSRRAAKAGRVPRSRVQDFRSRKTGHRSGSRRRIVRLHHRHQCAARGERCPRDARPSA